MIQNVKPTVLIGVSGQAGAFTEEIIRTIEKNTERPVIFPLSNPTSRSEATPQQVLDWTNGRALIGTGSPFGPCKFNGKEIHIDQTNNSYIFPGLALGIISSKARQVSDAMIKAAALALADSWAIPCAGRDVYYRRHRAQWLAKIREAGVRRRAERLYEQLDMLQHLRAASPPRTVSGKSASIRSPRSCDRFPI